MVVTSLTSLLGLELRNNERVTDRGLSSLVKLPSLTYLNLDFCPGITGRGVKTLCVPASRLVTVSLVRCAATDPGVERIARLPCLSTLFLSHARVTDRGLQALASSRSLAYVGVEVGEGVTHEGIEQLRRRMQGRAAVNPAIHGRAQYDTSTLMSAMLSP